MDLPLYGNMVFSLSNKFAGIRNLPFGLGFWPAKKC
jgi:hypothetical protein